MQNLRVFPTAVEARVAVAQAVVEQIQERLTHTSKVRVALTGGSDGSAITTEIDRLTRSMSLPIGCVHVWWSDERFVELEDELRNDLELVNAQITQGPNSALTIHRAPAPSQVSNIADAVTICESDFDGPNFDIAVVGVGPDGHFASLFPEIWDKSAQANFLAVTNSPKPPSQRLTASYELLSKTTHVIVAGTGSTKSRIFDAALDKDPSLPITYLLELPHVDLYLDSSAASLLDDELVTTTMEKS